MAYKKLLILDIKFKDQPLHDNALFRMNIIILAVIPYFCTKIGLVLLELKKEKRF